MTTQTVDAIFKQGSFRFVQPLNIPLCDGQHVRLVVEMDESPEAILGLATSVYTDLSDEDINEVEQIALQRSFRVFHCHVERSETSR